jgi:opacity protein-like surface antigen
MRKVIFAAALLAVGSIAMAEGNTAKAGQNPSLIVGGQLGYIFQNYSTGDFNYMLKTNPQTKVRDNGFSARLYLGYDFTPNIGAEVGYLYLPKVRYKINDTILFSFRQQLFDMFVKGSYPVNDSVSIYGKAGAAWIHRNKVQTLVQTDPDPSKNKYQYYDQEDKIAPALGIGATYNYNENLGFDVTASHYFQNGVVRSVSLIGLGALYKFEV